MQYLNKNSAMKLGPISIGEEHPPFIIAEISANHKHDLNRVMNMLEGAREAGVQCIKLQTWTAEGMTLNIQEDAFFIKDPNSLWNGYSLYDLYQEARLPWEWHKPIFDRCRELGLLAISTPFDLESVDFLESLNVPFYKIASFENVDLNLIGKVATTGKPIIISSGLATARQLIEAVECARNNGAHEIVVLKCTSQYPADPQNVNLKTIPHMRELLRCEVGFSDHTQGIGTAIASIALGASVIEKHFTLSEQDESLDAAFSVDMQQMKMLVQECYRAWQAKGQVYYGINEDEKDSLQFRRSLYIGQDMKKGEILTKNNVCSIRPGFGLPPKYLNLILGRLVTRDTKRGTPLCWNMIGELPEKTFLKNEILDYI